MGDRAPEPENSAAPQPLFSPETLWWAWVIGPGSFGLALVYGWLMKAFTDPPDLRLACVLVVSQIIAAVMTFTLAMDSGQRRKPEFWLLIAYWLSFVSLFAVVLACGSEAPNLSRVCLITTSATIVLPPIVRFFRAKRRSRS
ncbi:MAG: hypothetical protein NXI31_06625 [bacterium]|nr:hypothetical protein [bacterium]